MSKSYFSYLDPSIILGGDLVWSLGGKICRDEQMLRDVSKAGSVPRQKQQSQTIPPATQTDASPPQTVRGRVAGLCADTLHPARGAEGWEAAGDLLSVSLAALLAWCRSVGRSSRHSPESPLQPDLVPALPFLQFLQYLPSLKRGT